MEPADERAAERSPPRTRHASPCRSGRGALGPHRAVPVALVVLLVAELLERAGREATGVQLGAVHQREGPVGELLVGAVHVGPALDVGVVREPQALAGVGDDQGRLAGPNEHLPDVRDHPLPIAITVVDAVERNRALDDPRVRPEDPDPGRVAGRGAGILGLVGGQAPLVREGDGGLEVLRRGTQLRTEPVVSQVLDAVERLVVWHGVSSKCSHDAANVALGKIDTSTSSRMCQPSGGREILNCDPIWRILCS